MSGLADQRDTVADAAEADLADGEEVQSDAATRFHAEILLLKQEALDLRQRAIEASAINSFAARSALGQMEGDLAELHDSVRSAYRALLTQQYGDFDRLHGEPTDTEARLIREHQTQIRQELDAVSAEVIRTRSAISDQKTSQMLTSGLILGLAVLLVAAGILLVAVL